MHLACPVMPQSSCFGFATTPATNSFSQTKQHHVVIALTSSDEADWKMTIGNIQNLLKQLSPSSTEVEVVAYGPGLAFEKKGSSVESAITGLETQGVHFVACANSMRVQGVTSADLIAGVTVVPSGVAEVVERQEHGWAYIKAGR